MNRLAYQLALLLGLSLLVTACATDTAAQRPVSEALRRDAAAYAEAQDVSLDEAIRRLTLQDPAGELNAVLQEQEPGVFAGLWIEHEPAYQVVVAVTRDQRRIWRRYIEGSPIADEVRIAQATVSYRDLQEAQAQTMAVLDAIGSRASTGIDLPRNCVVVYADPAALEPRVEAAGEALPDPLCFEPTSFPPPPPLDPPPGITFPRRDPPEGLTAEMAALLIGELVQVAGCLRVRAEGYDAGILVIWPYDHTVTADEFGNLEVRDGAGQVVAREGETVRMGGGEVPVAMLDGVTSMEIPVTCLTDKVWIAASGIATEGPD
ncbi:MAG: hypothetical protein JXC32_01780 [Anaerolineae bacterium]|nr:hypothetical protein [Anaerolineae bacterium]